MRKTIIFSVVSIACFSIQAQIKYLKFIGYDQEAPVFQQVSGTNESPKAELVAIDEENQKTKVLMDISSYRGIFDYLNGELIVADQEKKLLTVSKGGSKELIVSTDEKKQKNFSSSASMLMSFKQASNLSFSSDGTEIYFSFEDGSVQKMHVKTGVIDQVSEAMELGSFCPFEKGGFLFFLTGNRNGSGDILVRKNLKDGSTKELPIILKDLPVRLSLDALGNLVLFVLKEKGILQPMMYNIALDKFKKISIPEIAIYRRFKVLSDLDQVYYSLKKKEWRYVVVEKGKLVSKSLGIALGDDSFDLTLKDLNKLSVTLDDVEEGTGLILTSSSQVRTIREEIEEEVSQKNKVFSNGQAFKMVKYLMGDLNSSFRKNGAEVTVYWPLEEGRFVPEGTYQLASPNRVYDQEVIEKFVDIQVVVNGIYYEMSKDSKGEVALKSVDGEYHINLTFSVEGLESPMVDEKIDAVGAMKIR